MQQLCCYVLGQNHSQCLTTTHRMHEVDRLAFIFGCSSCADTVTHYLACPLLLFLIHENYATPFGPSVAHRRRSIERSIVHIHMIAMFSDVYHILKGGLKNRIMEAFRRYLFANVHSQARRLANDCFYYYENHFLEQVRPQETKWGRHV